MEFQGLVRVQDVEKESHYGYVYGVSGPGKLNEALSMFWQYYLTHLVVYNKYSQSLHKKLLQFSFACKWY